MSKSKYPAWKAGDLFFKPQWPSVIYRVHRRHGTTIFFLNNHLGTQPPRGMLREAHAAESVSWVRVERNYATPQTATFPRNATTYQFTNQGRRCKTRGKCEKCNTATNWIVMVSGRPAYWCGCD